MSTEQKKIFWLVKAGLWGGLVVICSLAFLAAFSPLIARLLSVKGYGIIFGAFGILVSGIFLLLPVVGIVSLIIIYRSKGAFKGIALAHVLIWIPSFFMLCQYPVIQVSRLANRLVCAANAVSSNRVS